MTTQEAIKELKSQNKPYAGIIPQSQFSNTIRQIEAGLSKPATIERFLAKFGYKLINIEMQWEKK